MMNLYRSVDECPQLPDPLIEIELSTLEKERDSGPEGEFMVDAFNRMGKEKFVRYVELREMTVDQQFFCDSRDQLLAQTGNNRYVVKISLHDDTAFAHVSNEDEASAANQKFIVNAGNYSFTGRELGEFRKDWSYQVIDMHSNEEDACPI